MHKNLGDIRVFSYFLIALVIIGGGGLLYWFTYSEEYEELDENSASIQIVDRAIAQMSNK